LQSAFHLSIALLVRCRTRATYTHDFATLDEVYHPDLKLQSQTARLVTLQSAQTTETERTVGWDYHPLRCAVPGNSPTRAAPRFAPEGRSQQRSSFRMTHPLDIGWLVPFAGSLAVTNAVAFAFVSCP